MFRIAACALAAMAVAATASHAADLSDAANTFRVTVPDGWVAEPPAIQVSLAVTSPRKPETGGNCTIVTGSDKTSKATSQAEFDDFLATQVNEPFWRTVASSINGVRSGTVEAGGKTRRGRMVFFAKLTTTIATSDGTLSLTQLMDVQGIPGRLYVVTCTALTKGFDREAADFEAIMTSFEPDASASPARRTMLEPGWSMASIAPAARASMMAGAARAVTR